MSTSCWQRPFRNFCCPRTRDRSRLAVRAWSETRLLPRRRRFRPPGGLRLVVAASRCLPRSGSMSERQRARARPDRDAATGAPDGDRRGSAATASRCSDPARSAGRPPPAGQQPAAGFDSTDVRDPALNGRRPRPVGPLNRKTPGAPGASKFDAPDQIPGGGQSDGNVHAPSRPVEGAVRAHWIRHPGIACGSGRDQRGDGAGRDRVGDEGPGGRPGASRRRSVGSRRSAPFLAPKSRQPCSAARRPGRRGVGRECPPAATGSSPSRSSATAGTTRAGSRRGTPDFSGLVRRAGAAQPVHERERSRAAPRGAKSRERRNFPGGGAVTDTAEPPALPKGRP